MLFSFSILLFVYLSHDPHSIHFSIHSNCISLYLMFISLGLCYYFHHLHFFIGFRSFSRSLWFSYRFSLSIFNICLLCYSTSFPFQTSSFPCLLISYFIVYILFIPFYFYFYYISSPFPTSSHSLVDLYLLFLSTIYFSLSYHFLSNCLFSFFRSSVYLYLILLSALSPFLFILIISYHLRFQLHLVGWLSVFFSSLSFHFLFVCLLVSCFGVYIYHILLTLFSMSLLFYLIPFSPPLLFSFIVYILQFSLLLFDLLPYSRPCLSSRSIFTPFYFLYSMFLFVVIAPAPRLSPLLVLFIYSTFLFTVIPSPLHLLPRFFHWLIHFSFYCPYFPFIFNVISYPPYLLSHPVLWSLFYISLHCFPISSLFTSFSHFIVSSGIYLHCHSTSSPSVSSSNSIASILHFPSLLSHLFPTRVLVSSPGLFFQHQDHVTFASKL